MTSFLLEASQVGARQLSNDHAERRAEKDCLRRGGEYLTQRLLGAYFYLLGLNNSKHIYPVLIGSTRV